MNLIDTLIFDRTLADAERVKQLKKIGFSNMTAEERAEWLSGMKGSYNATDLNRVGCVINYIADRLNEAGFVIRVSPKVDWTESDIPTLPEMSRYLTDLSVLRCALPPLSDTPEIPADMRGLTVSEANAIEHVLYNLELIINAMCSVRFRAGQALLFCGFGIYMKQPETGDYITVYTADGKMVVTADMQAVVLKEG